MLLEANLGRGHLLKLVLLRNESVLSLSSLWTPAAVVEVAVQGRIKATPVGTALAA